MAFVPIPNTARVVCRFQQFTEERQLVLHYHKAAGQHTLADLVDLTNNIVDWWNDVGKFACSTSLALFEVTATDISVAGGAQNTQPVSPAVAGTLTGDVSPGSVTSTLSWRTALTGRSRRGRSFFPGFRDVDTNDDGTVTVGKMALLAAAGANLLFGYTVAGQTLAVASKVLELSTPIIRVVTENIVDSQRRRLPKRGI